MYKIVLTVLALATMPGAVQGQVPPEPVGGGGFGRFKEGPVEAPVGDGGLGLKPFEVPIGCRGLCKSEIFARNIALFGYAPSTAALDYQETLAFPLDLSAHEGPRSSLEAPRTTFSATRADLEDGLVRIDKTTKVCTPRTGIPTETWREALVQARSLQLCDEAVRPLLEARRSDSASYFSFLSGSAAPGNNFEILKLLFYKYKESCLQMLSDYEERTAFKEVFGKEFSDELRANVGTLIGSQLRAGKSFPCMASIVRLPDKEAKSALALATAAHCIGVRRSNGNGIEQVVLPFEQLEFRSLAGQIMDVKIDSDVRDWTFPVSNDLAIIPLALGAGGSSLKGLTIASSSSLSAWEPLYLFAVNPVVLALNQAESRGAGVLVEDAVTISLGTPCRIYGVGDGQMLHGCETEKQMSGSPIFLIEGESARIAAVHTGGDSRTPLVCEPASLPAVNRAVLLTGMPGR